jgi:hypothetical protein
MGKLAARWEVTEPFRTFGTVTLSSHQDCRIAAATYLPEEEDIAEKLITMATASASTGDWAEVDRIHAFAVLVGHFGNHFAAAAAVYISQLIRLAWPAP